MGIRNSFGLTIDPVTGFLWDTENGPKNFDEVNLVEEKFNSGWTKIIGPSTDEEQKNLPTNLDFKYSDPEFSWESSVAPTAITFVQSHEFEEYQNSVLVASFNLGTIYKFNLNKERTGFVFDEPVLTDLVANVGDPTQELVFGTGFGGVTDIKVGPDGLLYVVSIIDGVIYRITPDYESKVLTEKAVSNCENPPQPHVNWSGCQIEGTDLFGAKLMFANLTNINLFQSNLQNADLSHAILENANLSEANLKDAILLGANLNGADLSETNLENTNFLAAQLINTDLSFSNLINADLSRMA